MYEVDFIFFILFSVNFVLRDSGSPSNEYIFAPLVAGAFNVDKQYPSKSPSRYNRPTCAQKDTNEDICI